MRRRSFLLLAAAPLRVTAKTPVLKQVDLFHAGDGGVHTYRIPALLETRKGSLLAIVDARHDSARDMPARISLVMRKSSDRGRTWSAVRTVRAVSEGGVGDASLLLDRKSGRIWCFHSYGPPGIGLFTARPGAVTGPGTFQFHAIWSDDDGESWSQPVDFTPQVKDPSWEAMFATSGTHFQTSAGRYLVPTVVRDADKQVASHNAWSGDGGKSWKIGPAIAPGSDESKAVELAGGTVLQNMRDGKSRLVARSGDGGVTFGAPEHDGALVDPGCNAGMARYLAKGRDLLIFTNAASTRRENLTVKVSADGGRTWPRARALHPGPAAYSTVIVLRDGSIAVLYEHGEKNPYEKLTFARFPVDWV